MQKNKTPTCWNLWRHFLLSKDLLQSCGKKRTLLRPNPNTTRWQLASTVLPFFQTQLSAREFAPKPGINGKAKQDSATKTTEGKLDLAPDHQHIKCILQSWKFPAYRGFTGNHRTQLWHIYSQQIVFAVAKVSVCEPGAHLVEWTHIPLHADQAAAVLLWRNGTTFQPKASLTIQLTNISPLAITIWFSNVLIEDQFVGFLILLLLAGSSRS